ncbi:hypothetical protein GUITHDRAFT_151648 [Guillardia theta CCMP2712]|uniref:Uncharacterized protein n=1 Tax=Guillardia theta (strain CCMP2712) TaxID=905079 RepID=L1JLJ4_GUITC|nr:hypothetical protein GUITHDRAFT_151648 [Guillardia theta CCMP2712]EKX49222.1 hypothetical protein GUITHDRAFT_151648 [Guillardia theta CCMP2712]|eukprot:XP_005836202.1 hypothetical protein GUITHDRAFT_151648 [Guillardia theta CCMP2712]
MQPIDIQPRIMFVTKTKTPQISKMAKIPANLAGHSLFRSSFQPHVTSTTSKFAPGEILKGKIRPRHLSLTGGGSNETQLSRFFPTSSLRPTP